MENEIVFYKIMAVPTLFDCSKFRIPKTGGLKVIRDRRSEVHWRNTEVLKS